jgi:DNA-binding GntR family transcriptional regulator
LEHDRLISALAARDRARCTAELEHHRYSAEDGLPIELPGVGDDLPGVTN